MIAKIFMQQKALNEISKIEKFILPTSLQIIPNYFSQIEKFIAQQEVLNHSFEKHKEALANFKFLVGRGWYVSIKVIDELEFSQLSEVYEFTKEENLNELENYIITTFDDRKINIFQSLYKTFVNREHIIREIEILYNSNLFYGLIPLCYSQADGISNEKWGFAFFDSDKNNNLKLQQLNSTNETLESLISHQLMQPKNEMTLYSKDSKFKNEKIKESSINRHLIIHGHSIHYGTKTNAIRAILLLEFIGELINESFKVNESKK